MMEREEYLRLLVSGYQRTGIRTPAWLEEACREHGISLHIQVSTPDREKKWSIDEFHVFAVFKPNWFHKKERELLLLPEGDRFVSLSVPWSGVVTQALLRDLDGVELGRVTLAVEKAVNAGDTFSLELNFPKG